MSGPAVGGRGGSGPLLLRGEHPGYVQSIQINTYELVDGQWEVVVGGGGQSFSDPKGRVALSFGKLTEGVRVAFQGETSSGATSYTINPEEDVSAMTCATSSLARSVL